MTPPKKVKVMAHERTAPQPTPVEITCKVCGKTVELMVKPGPKPVCCSPECKKVALQNQWKAASAKYHNKRKVGARGE